MATKSKEKQSCPIVILSATGEIKDHTIETSGNVTVTSLKSMFKKKAVIENFGTYPYNNLTLFMFGVLAGESGEENNHQLPPPYDTTQIYSDIVILASNDENSFSKPTAFNQEDYEGFYSKQFGGDASDLENDELDVVDNEKDFEVEVEVEDEQEPVLEDEEGDVEVDGEAEGEAEGAEGDEDDVLEAVKSKPKRKKAAPKPVVLNMVGPANAYQNKPTLSEDEQLQVEKEVTPLVDTPRKDIYKVIEKIFVSKLSSEQMLTLELCIYNGAIRESTQLNSVRSWKYPLFVHIYKMRARKILSNFDETSYVQNTELFKLFKDGTINMDELSAMNTYELFPSIWRDQFEKQKIREKKQEEGNRNMATDMFLCTRCSKRQCTYYEMQTRSADEPMTIFITCVNCGKHWRQ